MNVLYSLPFRLFVIDEEVIEREKRKNKEIESKTSHEGKSSKAVLSSLSLEEEEIRAILEGKLIKKEIALLKKYGILKVVGFKKELPSEFHSLEISLSPSELEIISWLIDSNFEEFRSKAFSLFSHKMKKISHYDEVISNTIKAIDEVDVSINQLSKRAGELASNFLPSLFYHRANENINYHSIFSSLVDLSLEDFNKKAEEDPLGKPIDPYSFKILHQMIEMFLNEVDYRASLLVYLKELLREYSPNLLELLGPTITARMIAEAGSLKRLAFLPSSTIQLLGAEKAFFKYLKLRSKKQKDSKCPKYGYIFQHQFIQKTPSKKRGKAARFFADKIALCARCDFFTKRKISDEVIKQLEEFREKLKG